MFMNELLQTAAAQPNMLVTMLPFILIFVIFYVFMIRPQNKKQKETEKMIAAIKKGDKVITIGGIHGVVSSTNEKTITVKVDDNCKLEFNRAAVSAVVSDEKKQKGKINKKNKVNETPKEVVDETKEANTSEDK